MEQIHLDPDDKVALLLSRQHHRAEVDRLSAWLAYIALGKTPGSSSAEYAKKALGYLKTSELWEIAKRVNVDTEILNMDEP